MKKTLITTSLILFSPLSFALNLVEAYDRAKNTDPNWQANLFQYEAEQQNLGLARANLLPTVTVSGSVSRRQQDFDESNFWSGVVNSLDLIPAKTTTKQAAISVRQPLFRLDAWRGYKQVKTSLQLSEVTLKLQRQKHILNVSEAYFNVLRQQALTGTNIQEEKALLEQMKVMNAKLKEGLVSQSDVGEANAQYQNARANRIGTGVQLVLAQEQLAQLIGPYQDKLAILRDDFQYQKPIPSSLNEWTKLAETHNLEILQGKFQLQYANDQRRIEEATRYPKVDAVGAYGYSEQSPRSVIASDGQFDQIGVEMNWNIYTGGRTSANVKKAKFNVKKTDSQLSAIVRKATIDVKKSYLQVETDQSSLQARKTAMDSSALVSRASQAKYNEGLKSMVDVLLAQRNAFAAKQQYVNTQYDYILNVLRLKAAIGQLNEQELAQMNAWLVYK